MDHGHIHPFMADTMLSLGITSMGKQIKSISFTYQIIRHHSLFANSAWNLNINFLRTHWNEDISKTYENYVNQSSTANKHEKNSFDIHSDDSFKDLLHLNASESFLRQKKCFVMLASLLLFLFFFFFFVKQT